MQEGAGLILKCAELLLTPSVYHGPCPKLPGFCWIQTLSGSTCPETFCREWGGNGFSLYSLFFSQFYLEFCTHPCSQMCQHKTSGFKVCHCWLRFELSLGKMFITNVLLLHLFLSHSICLYFVLFFTSISLVAFPGKRGNKCLCLRCHV